MEYTEKEIPHHPHYLATSTGDIITLKKGQRRKLTKCLQGDGFFRVSIMPGSELGKLPSRCRTVASLILEAFVGPRPSPDHVAAHLNDDNTDDRACNLAWQTYSEVMNRRVTRALQSANVESVVAQLSGIIRRIQAQHDSKDIARATDLSPHLIDTLRSCLLGLTMKHGRASHYRRKANDERMQRSPNAKARNGTAGITSAAVAA